MAALFSAPVALHSSQFAQTHLTQRFSKFSAAGERRAANDGDVAGDVVRRGPESGGAVTVVDGDDDGRRGRLWRGEHPRGWHHGARLLRERQAHDDGPRDRANGLQLSVRQCGEASFGRLPEASAHGDLLLLLPHADALHHRPGALPQHQHGQLSVSTLLWWVYFPLCSTFSPGRSFIIVRRQLPAFSPNVRWIIHRW